MTRTTGQADREAPIPAGPAGRGGGAIPAGQAFREAPISAGRKARDNKPTENENQSGTKTFDR